jgi:hypothetical protein
MDSGTGSEIRDGMAPRKARPGEGKAHRFGGDWTGAKLEVLAKYLSGYTTALKKQPFVKGYIDAFAGTGYRTARKDRADASSQELLFPDLAATEPQSLLDGSARLALKTEPGSTGTCSSSAVRNAAPSSRRSSPSSHILRATLRFVRATRTLRRPYRAGGESNNRVNRPLLQRAAEDSVRSGR